MILKPNAYLFMTDEDNANALRRLGCRNLGTEIPKLLLPVTIIHRNKEETKQE